MLFPVTLVLGIDKELLSHYRVAFSNDISGSSRLILTENTNFQNLFHFSYLLKYRQRFHSPLTDSELLQMSSQLLRSRERVTSSELERAFD